MCVCVRMYDIIYVAGVHTHLKYRHAQPRTFTCNYGKELVRNFSYLHALKIAWTCVSHSRSKSVHEHTHITINWFVYIRRYTLASEPVVNAYRNDIKKHRLGSHTWVRSTPHSVYRSLRRGFLHVLRILYSRRLWGCCIRTYFQRIMCSGKI